MNGKQSKKIRQEVNKKARDFEEEATRKAVERFFKYTLKPKPFWIPKPVWFWLLHRILNF